MIYNLKSPFIEFHGQFVSVKSQLPEKGKAKEILKRIAIVIVAPLAYIALGFLYLVGKTCDFFKGKKNVTEEALSAKLEDVAKKILKIKDKTEDGQSAKFFLQLQVGEVTKHKVFIVRNSEIDEKNLEKKLRKIVRTEIAPMVDSYHNAMVKASLSGFIRHDDPTINKPRFSHAYALGVEYITRGATAENFNSDRIKVRLANTLKILHLPVEPQLDVNAEFIEDCEANLA